MPLGGSKDEHFSCFDSSCQLEVNQWSIADVIRETENHFGIGF